MGTNSTDLCHSHTQDLQLNTISWIALCSSALSMLGSLSIVLCAVYKQKLCMPEVNPICQLSAADFLAALFLFLGAALHLSPQKKEGWQCNILTNVTAAFFICTFFLTLTYAVEVFFRIRRRLDRKRQRVQRKIITGSCVLSILSWVLPLTALVSIEVAKYKIKGTDDGTCEICLPIFHYSADSWKGKDRLKQWQFAGKLLFLIPLLLVITGNLVFYVLALCTFHSSIQRRGVLGYREAEEVVRARNKAILYQMVFCLSWLPSLALGFLSLGDQFHTGNFFFLYILQALLSPLQGFWNSLIYGWKRKGFTTALYEAESTVLTSTNAPTYSTFQF